MNKFLNDSIDRQAGNPVLELSFLIDITWIEIFARIFRRSFCIQPKDEEEEEVARGASLLADDEEDLQ